MTITRQPSRQRQASLRGSKIERDHFSFLHQLQCVVSGKTLRLEATHIRYPDALFEKPIAGTSAKPDPWWCVPLDADLHRAQHSIGERKFWKDHGFDPDDSALSPLALCLKLWGFSRVDDIDGAMAAIASHRWETRL